MKLFTFILILSSFMFVILFSYCFKNILAQTNGQDLTYEPSSFGIKINYPSDWKANSDEADQNAEKTTIVVFYPKINSNVTDGSVKIWVDNNPRTNNLDLYLQNELVANKKNIVDYTFSGSTIDSTLSNHSAFSYSYNSKVNGKEVTSFVVGALINGKVYELTYLAQTDKFFVNLSNANRIINSFEVIPSSFSSSGGGSGSEPRLVNSSGNGSSSNNNATTNLQSGVRGAGGGGSAINSNPQAINNINIVNQLNDIKKNKTGIGSGSEPRLVNSSGNGSSSSNNKNTIANSQSTGVGTLTNTSPKIGPSNNQPITPNYIVSKNKPTPIANAGHSQTVSEGDVVLLNASNSYDPDGDPITFSWRQIGGPAVKLDNTTIALPSFTAPSVPTDRKIVFELTVKDDEGLKNTSTVTVIDLHIVPALSTTLPSSQPLGNSTQLLSTSDNINTTNKAITAKDVKSDTNANLTITPSYFDNNSGKSSSSNSSFVSSDTTSNTSKKLSTSILIGKNTINPGRTQSITILVSDASTNSPIKGALVTSTLIEPPTGTMGKAMTMSRAHDFKGTTDETGHVSFSLKIKSNLKPGQFNILVQVSAEGYPSKTSTAIFTVTRH